MNNLPLLEDLRLFCVVARNMSFIASAKELGISPAYVSKRIGMLEDVLNVRLLLRTTRRVSMTHYGETIYRWARQIIEDVEQMTESVTMSKTTLRGQLRISTSAGSGRKRVAPALSEFAQRYPALRIQLELLDRPVDLIEQVDGAVVDLDLSNNHAQETVIVDCAVPVSINIKPGDPGTDMRNTIHLQDKSIAVAVLSTAAGEYGNPVRFDATTIDVSEARFGLRELVWSGGGAGERHGKSHREDSFELDDITRDGDDDLVLHFRGDETGLRLSDTEGCIRAESSIGGDLATCFGSAPLKVIGPK